jgi:hypothetical protein
MPLFCQHTSAEPTYSNNARVRRYIQTQINTSHKFYHQLVAHRIYYTQLLHVSAIYPSHWRELQVWSTCAVYMVARHRQLAEYILI